MPHEKTAGEPGLIANIPLFPVPPYDFALSTRIFSTSDSVGRGAAEGRFWEVLRLKEGLALSRVTAGGSTDSPILNVQFFGTTSMSPDAISEARSQVEKILNLSLDLAPFIGISEKEPFLHMLVRSLWGLKPPLTSTVFEALVESIIEQQISLIAAHRIQEQLIRLLGDVIRIGERIYYGFPTAERIARTTDEQLRGCGLSHNKASYISGIAREVQEGRNLESLTSKNRATEDIRAELCEIRGVGPWTAELVLLRGIGRYEVFPADDLGLRKAISRYYRKGTPLTAQEARALAERWGSWKGLAGFYMIMGEWMGIELSDSLYLPG